MAKRAIGLFIHGILHNQIDRQYDGQARPDLSGSQATPWLEELHNFQFRDMEAPAALIKIMVLKALESHLAGLFTRFTPLKNVGRSSL